MKKIIKYCVKNGIEFAYYPDVELWMFAKVGKKPEKELLITQEHMMRCPGEILVLIEERVMN